MGKSTWIPRPRFLTLPTQPNLSPSTGNSTILYLADLALPYPTCPVPLSVIPLSSLFTYSSFLQSFLRRIFLYHHRYHNPGISDTRRVEVIDTSGKHGWPYHEKGVEEVGSSEVKGPKRSS